MKYILPLTFYFGLLLSPLAQASAANSKQTVRQISNDLCLSSSPKSATSILFSQLAKEHKPKDEIQTLVICLSARGLVTEIEDISLHFGFRPRINEPLIQGLLEEFRSSELNAIKKIVQGLPPGLILDDENEAYLLRGVRKKFNTDLKAVIFANLWKQSLLEENRVQFLNILNVDYLVSVRIKMNRPKYGSKMADLSHGGPFFHLGPNTSIIDTESLRPVADGYAQRDGAYKNSPTPNRSATEWARYDIGLKRLPLYPEHESQFLMMNRSPMTYVQPEIDLTNGSEYFSKQQLPLSLATTGHDLFILRYKGQEYITFEGRPCTPTEDRNIFTCEMPISFSKINFEKAFSELSLSESRF